MLRLALRNILRQKFRTAMTLAVIVFGVAGLILSGGFVEDMLVQLGETIIRSQSGHLQVLKTGYFAKGGRSPDQYLIERPEVLRRSIEKLPQVDDVMLRMNFSGLINNGRSDWPILGEGVEPDGEARLGTHLKITAGRQLTSADHSGILLGEGVARSLNLQPGATVTLLLNTAEGALNTQEFEVIGIFQTFSKDFDARAVRISLAAAQELIGNRLANSVVVSLKSTSDTENVAASLRTLLDGKKLEIKTWQELNDFYSSTVALYERQFGVLQAIILMMVLLSVGNSVNMSAFERVGEFGTMMALGNNRLLIFKLVVVENTLLGAVGAVLGITIGIALALAISAIGIPMPPPPNANIGYTALIRVVPSVVAIAFVVGLMATVLAAIFPASRVARTPVADALRQNH
ncbi:MAG: ABC transporter permease [Candidatus Accumulibacter necessarius]|jgi:putative ABC transport system permease protein|uniref:ABC transporter permease n=1 Tax=Candidatus Accumulibacter necessarius TaxID=2954386 RepID=UPI002FC30281